MSFMYNPYPYDDPRAINKRYSPPRPSNPSQPELRRRQSDSPGNSQTLKATPQRNLIVAFDGYTTADWTRTINLSRSNSDSSASGFEAMDFARVSKPRNRSTKWSTLSGMGSHEEADATLGRIFRGTKRCSTLRKSKGSRRLSELQASADHGKVIAVYGYGCLVERLRGRYDRKCYFDVTPKESILRIRRGEYANLKRTARPANLVIRRCYYVDFEMAVTCAATLAAERTRLLCRFRPSRPDHLLPRNAMERDARRPGRLSVPLQARLFGRGLGAAPMSKTPQPARRHAQLRVGLRPDPDGGQHRRRGRCRAGRVPFFTFVQREGEAIMGDACVKKFHGYFPIRFNYDDSYHSNGNMSIQVHSGAVTTKKITTSWDVRTKAITWSWPDTTPARSSDSATTPTPRQFIRDIKRADTEYKPVDYLKIRQLRGFETRIAGHASGRNHPLFRPQPGGAGNRQPDDRFLHPTNSTITCAPTSTASPGRSTPGTANATLHSGTQGVVGT